MKPLEAAFFSKAIRDTDPAARIVVASDRENLVSAARKVPDGTRLIAFSTNVIAPPAVLERVNYNSVNFHPGPPSRPGYRPTGFALYEGDAEYGVTAHYMLDEVDAGPIIAARFFPLAPDAVLIDVVKQAYLELARLLMSLLPDLGRSGVPLEPNGMTWSGEKTTRARYEVIRSIPISLPESELRERFRCFDGIYSPLDGDGNSR